MTNPKTLKVNQPIVSDHIARIEGKAGIEVTVTDSQLDQVKLNIFEGPRFFEQITVGKPLEEAVAVFPRICSFCASAHKVTALQAAEDAIGLQPTAQTMKLRELMYLGDMIESHALHLFLLAIPDFLGYHDAFSMAKDYKDAVNVALELKDVGAKIQTIVGSRYIHQENAQLGGFGKIPTERALKSIIYDLKEVTLKSELAAEILMNHSNWPEVTKERVHLALKPDNGFDNKYNFLGNTIVSSNGSEFHQSKYREEIKEKVVSHSFAKHGFYKNKPFMTGALSRFTLFGDTMYGRGHEIALMNKKHLDPNNPMSNNFAQAVELIYFVERSINITNDIIENLKPLEKRIKPRFTKSGNGFSTTEAPRGMVSYNLKTNSEGIVTEADIITPTSYFMPIMEADVGRMAQGLLDKGIVDTTEIGKKLETIVRSYDPCVSCSVHVTRVK
jgi:sulfhydrogenase subunit alpha